MNKTKTILQDGAQCPECNHGIIEVLTFGDMAALDYEIHAYCTGLNGVRKEDIDEEDANDCGCGWWDLHQPNENL